MIASVWPILFATLPVFPSYSLLLFPKLGGYTVIHFLSIPPVAYSLSKIIIIKKLSLIDVVSHMHGQAKSPLPYKLHTLCSFRLPLSQEHILLGNNYSCSHSHQPKKADLEYSSGLCLTRTKKKKHIVLATSTLPFDKMCKIQLWSEGQDYCSVGSFTSCLY